MKKVALLILMLLFTYSSAQENFELTTMRIGPFHLKMDVNEADKIAKKPLSAKKNEGNNVINYQGEIVEVHVYETSDSETGTSRTIGFLKTSSKKFRTKSGVGVGSSKDELIDAFRNFKSFCIMPERNDDGSPSATESSFVLTDVDAYTFIRFSMKNNIVYDVGIYFDEGGC